MDGKNRVVNKKNLIKIIVSACGMIVIIVILLLLIGNRSDDEKRNIVHRRQWWLKSINWDHDRDTYTGRGITVAVVDTGVDENTVEIKDKIKKEISVLDSEDKGDTTHGTAVCGIIAGTSFTSKGVSGIADNVSIISVDITNDKEGIIEVDDLVEGIQIAIDHKVDIINISVGCLENSEKLKNVVNEAMHNDIIVVASAGNYMEDSILYPAAYDSVIAVGGVDKDGERISPVGKLKKSIVYLPGESIVAPIGNGKYAGCEGTSFSTAMCTGLIALLLEKNNDKESVIEYMKKINLKKTMDFKEIVSNYP
ncbi:MAG: S8 family peptidase [Eubacterium sp.]